MLNIIAYIESVRPGLGLVFVLVLAARLGALWSSLGRGIFLVAPRGRGKGDILEATSIPQLGFLIEAGEELHPKYVRKILDAAKAAGRELDRLAVLFEDLGDLHGDSRKIRKTLGFGSRQVSQLSSAFTGYTDEPNGGPNVFRSVSWACGMTPDVMEQIRGMGPWRAKWSDRFSRLGLVRTAADSRLIMNYKLKQVQVSKMEIRQRLTEMVGEVPQTVRIDVAPDKLEAGASEIWGSWIDDPRTRQGARIGDVQHTETRRLDYLRSDLRGMAALNGRDYVTESDLTMLELGGPLYRIGSLPPNIGWVVMLAQSGTGVSDIIEETGMNGFEILDVIRTVQRYGLLFPEIPNPKTPWTGSVKAGWYFADWLEDLEAIKHLGQKV